MLTLLTDSVSAISDAAISDYTGTESDERILAMWIHGKAIGTARMYRTVALEFLKFSQKSIRDLTISDVFAWVEVISPGMKPATIRTKLYAIKSLLSFANKTGYTRFNVGAIAKPPKVAVGIHKKCLAPNQIKSLVASVENTRDRLIISLGYIAGLRASEIAGLTWDCLHDGILTFVGKGGKERSIRLPDAIANELLEFKPANSNDDSPIFASRTRGGHLDRRSITRIVKSAAINAGESDKVSAHWLRHSHATNALEAGEDIKVIAATLGHSSPAFTMQVYVESKPEKSSALKLSI